eukprot:467858_1
MAVVVTILATSLWIRCGSISCIKDIDPHDVTVPDPQTQYGNITSFGMLPFPSTPFVLDDCTLDLVLETTFISATNPMGRVQISKYNDAVVKFQRVAIDVVGSVSDDSTSADVQHGLDIAAGAASIILGYASDNPVGIVSGIMDVIGGIFGFASSPDDCKDCPQILSNQKAINTNQQVINANQKIIMKGVDNLQNIVTENNKYLLDIQNLIYDFRNKIEWTTSYNDALPSILPINTMYKCYMHVTGSKVIPSTCCTTVHNRTDCKLELAKNILSPTTKFLELHESVFSLATGSAFYTGILQKDNSLLYHWAKLTWQYGKDNTKWNAFDSKWIENYLGMALNLGQILIKSSRCLVWASAIRDGELSAQAKQQWILRSQDLLSYSKYVFGYMPSFVKIAYLPSALKYSTECTAINNSRLYDCTKTTTTMTFKEQYVTAMNQFGMCKDDPIKWFEGPGNTMHDHYLCLQFNCNGSSVKPVPIQMHFIPDTNGNLSWFAGDTQIGINTTSLQHFGPSSYWGGFRHLTKQQYSTDSTFRFLVDEYVSSLAFGGFELLGYTVASPHSFIFLPWCLREQGYGGQNRMYYVYFDEPGNIIEAQGYMYQPQNTGTSGVAPYKVSSSHGYWHFTDIETSHVSAAAAVNGDSKSYVSELEVCANVSHTINQFKFAVPMGDCVKDKNKDISYAFMCNHNVNDNENHVYVKIFKNSACYGFSDAIYEYNDYFDSNIGASDFNCIGATLTCTNKEYVYIHEFGTVDNECYGEEAKVIVPAVIEDCYVDEILDTISGCVTTTCHATSSDSAKLGSQLNIALFIVVIVILIIAVILIIFILVSINKNKRSYAPVPMQSEID